ncbi:hypothetical protein VTI74DRAFT_2090 [Chaetomium olivicolor]
MNRPLASWRLSEPKTRESRNDRNVGGIGQVADRQSKKQELARSKKRKKGRGLVAVQKRVKVFCQMGVAVRTATRQVNEGGQKRAKERGQPAKPNPSPCEPRAVPPIAGLCSQSKAPVSCAAGHCSRVEQKKTSHPQADQNLGRKWFNSQFLSAQRYGDEHLFH